MLNGESNNEKNVCVSERGQRNRNVYAKRKQSWQMNTQMDRSKRGAAGGRKKGKGRETMGGGERLWSHAESEPSQREREEVTQQKHTHSEVEHSEATEREQKKTRTNKQTTDKTHKQSKKTKGERTKLRE